jgi:mRNA interferase RelE/StbE
MSTEQSRPTYKIELTRTAAKQLYKLPPDILRRIDEAILGLASNPRPSGTKKLSSQSDRYRIRIGDYRVIYEIYDTELVVFVVDVGHRKDIYRP